MEDDGQRAAWQPRDCLVPQKTPTLPAAKLRAKTGWGVRGVRSWSRVRRETARTAPRAPHPEGAREEGLHTLCRGFAHRACGVVGPGPWTAWKIGRPRRVEWGAGHLKTPKMYHSRCQSSPNTQRELKVSTADRKGVNPHFPPQRTERRKSHFRRSHYEISHTRARTHTRLQIVTGERLRAGVEPVRSVQVPLCLPGLIQVQAMRLGVAKCFFQSFYPETT